MSLRDFKKINILKNETIKNMDIEDFDPEELYGTPVNASLIPTDHINNTLTNLDKNIQSDIDELDSKKLDKTILNGGTTGQLLSKKTDSDLDFEWIDPTGGIISLNGVSVLRDPHKTYFVVSVRNPIFLEFEIELNTLYGNNITVDNGAGQIIEDVTGLTNIVFPKVGMFVVTVSGGPFYVNVGGVRENNGPPALTEVYGGNNLGYGQGDYRTIKAGENHLLHTVILPYVFNLEKKAFYDCPLLRLFEAPYSMLIDEDCLAGCESLKEVNLPMLYEAKSGAFSYSGLQKIFIPSTVALLGDNIFAGCVDLKYLTVGALNNDSYDGQNKFQGVSLEEYNIYSKTPIDDVTIEANRNLFLDQGGSIDGSVKIINSIQIQKTPTLDNDGVNKKYVDTAIANISNSSLYDIVIETQEQFEDLITSPTWLDATSVAFVGDGGTLEFTLDTPDNSGIKIPQTVKQIHGYNSAKIKIINFFANANIIKGCFWYEEIPEEDDYNIRDLSFVCEGADAGLANFKNITNCSVSNTTHYGRLSTTASSWEGYAFKDCVRLINCSGSSFSFGSTVLGTTIGIAFANCTQVINCVGTGIGQDGNTGTSMGYAFYDCSYGSNNRDVNSLTGATGGTMTKWPADSNDI